jgi:hypothetical protein
MAQAWFVFLLLGALLLGCETVTVGEGPDPATLSENEQFAQLGQRLAGSWKGIATFSPAGIDAAMFAFELSWRPDPDGRSGSLLGRCQFDGCVQGADEPNPVPTRPFEGRYHLHEIKADGTVNGAFETRDGLFNPLRIELIEPVLAFKVALLPIPDPISGMLTQVSGMFVQDTGMGGSADAGTDASL